MSTGEIRAEEEVHVTTMTGTTDVGDGSSRRPVVAVVFGGASTEHGVSCLTAASAVGAIDPDRFEVIGIGIAADGSWVRHQPEEIARLATVDRRLPEVDPDGPRAVLLHGPDGVVLHTVEGDLLRDPVRLDVALALLHGPFGEDGTLQGMFEMLGLRYVGPGVASSAVSMDKELMKQVFAAHEIPIGPWVSFTGHQWRADPGRITRDVAALAYPVYVKPARGGSSIGISRVGGPEELAAAIEEALRHDAKVVVEEGLVGWREVECAVLGNGIDAPEVSTTGEIVMHNESGFYDFDAKYLPEEQVTLTIPADLPVEVADRVRAAGAAAFTAVGAEGLSRVDCFVSAAGEVVVNEINTMPGFTEFSMYPKLWQATGVGYRDLISRLLDLALARPLGLR